MPALVVQFYPEHGIGEGFTDNPFYFYRFFFCHSYSLSYGIDKY
jgi:hypothetical protein